MMAPIFFFLTIFSIPFLPAGATVPRWAFLSLVCAALLFKIRPSLPMLIVIGYITVMAAVAPVWYDAAFLYWHFLLLAVLFAYVQELTDLRGMTIGLCLGLWVNSAVVIAQYFGFDVWPQGAYLDGLFLKHTFSSEAAAMALLLALGYRLWWLVPGLLPTLIFGSRAPLLAAGLAGLFLFWPKNWRYGASPFIALLLPAGAAVIAFHAIGNPTFWDSMDDRLGVWLDTVQGLSLFGHGLGSFMPDFPALQHHSDPLMIRYENTHNDMLQVIYELGIGGAVLIGFLFWRMACMDRSPAWYALLVFMVEGSFSFPLYEPVTGAVAACCAGYLFSGRHTLRGLFAGGRRGLQDRNGHGQDPVFGDSGTAIPTYAVAPLWSGLRGHRQWRSHWDTDRPAGTAV
jgi:hypothetical protein